MSPNEKRLRSGINLAIEELSRRADGPADVTAHAVISQLQVLVAPMATTKTAPTEEMEPVTIKQDRGPTLKFSGLLIAKTEFDMRSGGAMRYEIWETAGNALIAVSKTNRETRAVVVEPGYEFDMRCAVMDFFDWENRARSMVRDQLKWRLVREVA